MFAALRKQGPRTATNSARSSSTKSRRLSRCSRSSALTRARAWMRSIWAKACMFMAPDPGPKGSGVWEEVGSSTWDGRCPRPQRRTTLFESVVCVCK
eukprot:3584207-Rhodomonas_salina.1